jgi:hypothetical protein
VIRCFSSYGLVSQHRRYQVVQLCVSPSLISLYTYLMVSDTLTKSRSNVSRPTVAFLNIYLGWRIFICKIVDDKLFNRVFPSPISRGGDCLSVWYLRITLHTLYYSKCFSPSPISHGGEWLVNLSTDYFTWGRVSIQMIIYWFFYVCYFLVVRP